MDRKDAQPSRKALLRHTILKGLFLYVLAPAAILWLMARPLGDAVRRAETAVFWILPAALGAVILNWLVYRLIRRKRPSLLVFSQGVLCLLAVVIILQEALPPIHAMTSALITSGAFLALLYAMLLYFWFASRTTKLSMPLPFSSGCCWMCCSSTWFTGLPGISKASWSARTPGSQSVIWLC